MRLFLTGSVQPMFFNPYIKDKAEELGIRGFVRPLEDGRIEIFIEGNTDTIAQMIPFCKQGPYSTLIRKVEQRDEKFQDFKDFKILRI